MTVMGEDIAYNYGLDRGNIDHTDTVVMTADGLPMDIMGETEIEIKYKDKLVTTTAVISPEVKGVILSWQVSEALGIVRYDSDVWDNPESTKTVKKMTTPGP